MIHRTKKKAQQGFSLVEVMMAIGVLVVGMVSMLSVFCVAVSSTQTSKLDLIAKQLANEAYESVINARDTGQLQWSDILNSGSGGVFLSGAQPITYPGIDGIYGTNDDAAATPARTVYIPSKDGTGYDNQALTNFKRTIAITPVVDASGDASGDLRNLTITISYRTANGLARTYVLSNYISKYQ